MINEIQIYTLSDRVVIGFHIFLILVSICFVCKREKSISNGGKKMIRYLTRSVDCVEKRG